MNARICFKPVSGIALYFLLGMLNLCCVVGNLVLLRLGYHCFHVLCFCCTHKQRDGQKVFNYDAVIRPGRYDKQPPHSFCSGIPITIATTAVVTAER